MIPIPTGKMLVGYKTKAMCVDCGLLILKVHIDSDYMVLPCADIHGQGKESPEHNHLY